MESDGVRGDMGVDVGVYDETEGIWLCGEVVDYCVIKDIRDCCIEEVGMGSSFSIGPIEEIFWWKTWEKPSSSRNESDWD